MGEPDAPARPIGPLAVKRYRNLIYGFAKAAAILEEGVKDRPSRPSRRDRQRRETGEGPLPGEFVTPGGVVLPGGPPT